MNLLRASLVAQKAKNLPAVQETCVQFLGPEDPLEEGMATHSRILVLRIPRTEQPGWGGGGATVQRIGESQIRLK